MTMTATVMTAVGVTVTMMTATVMTAVGVTVITMTAAGVAAAGVTGCWMLQNRLQNRSSESFLRCMRGPLLPRIQRPTKISSKIAAAFPTKKVLLARVQRPVRHPRPVELVRSRLSRNRLVLGCVTPARATSRSRIGCPSIVPALSALKPHYDMAYAFSPADIGVVVQEEKVGWDGVDQTV
ncbi:unnamed protein product [Pylaiella littoralis]